MKQSVIIILLSIISFSNYAQSNTINEKDFIKSISLGNAFSETEIPMSPYVCVADEMGVSKDLAQLFWQRGRLCCPECGAVQNNEKEIQSVLGSLSENVQGGEGLI